MDEIADGAGISKPMINNYFGSKRRPDSAYVEVAGRRLLTRRPTPRPTPATRPPSTRRRRWRDLPRVLRGRRREPRVVVRCAPRRPPSAPCRRRSPRSAQHHRPHRHIVRSPARPCRQVARHGRRHAAARSRVRRRGRIASQVVARPPRRDEGGDGRSPGQRRVGRPRATAGATGLKLRLQGDDVRRGLIRLRDRQVADEHEDAGEEDVLVPVVPNPRPPYLWLFWDMKSPIDAPSGRVRMYASQNESTAFI